MSFKLTLVLLLVVLSLLWRWYTISWPAPADVRQRIAFFQDHPNADGLTNLRPARRFETLIPMPRFEQLMSRRAGLGRMIRTTEAVAQDLPNRVLVVNQNTEFERANVVERFDFQIEADGPHLSYYDLHIGKRYWCPMITVFWTQCSIEDAPVTPGAAR